MKVKQINTLGSNIKNYRTKKGLSQDKLTKKADITLTTLVKIETGNNKNPTIKTLVKIANALGVKVDDLINS
ncbi:MAG: helix-turn-helix transcriptional regulator [Actinomycetota bacterium]|nr:helix-turn-helix transcriptional regulator [Actinomycetota bacterium]